MMNTSVSHVMCGYKQAEVKTGEILDKGTVRHPGDKSVEYSIFLSCNGAHNNYYT